MQRVFGQLPDGVEIHALTLRSEAGLEAEVLTYGGILHTLQLITAQGVVPLVLNLPDLPAYAADGDSLNILVGRFGNRIAGARYTLEGVTHVLAANEGRNQLHGGLRGFGRRVWSVLEQAPDQVLLGYDSPNGEEGYPGNLHVRARLQLQGLSLQLEFEAHCDAATALNLTHHPYFNLSGDPQLRAAAQVLRVPADRYLPVDAESIPTGEIASVTGTPFDFRQPAALADNTDTAHPQIILGKGYDQCLVLAADADCVAELYSRTVAWRCVSAAMPRRCRCTRANIWTPTIPDWAVAYAWSRRIIRTPPITPTFLRPSCGRATPIAAVSAIALPTRGRASPGTPCVPRWMRERFQS